MKKQTVIRIETDYYGELSYDYYREEICNLVNELDVRCTIKNDKFINIVEQCKNYLNSEHYSNSVTFTSTGYSQSEWQEYLLEYNCSDEDIKPLIELLKRSFTHFNDYTVSKFERIIVDGVKYDSEPYDYTSFCIGHIEFPDEGDVLNEYLDIYGKDFDISIIELNK